MTDIATIQQRVRDLLGDLIPGLTQLTGAEPSINPALLPALHVSEDLGELTSAAITMGGRTQDSFTLSFLLLLGEVAHPENDADKLAAIELVKPYMAGGLYDVAAYLMARKQLQRAGSKLVYWAGPPTFQPSIEPWAKGAFAAGIGKLPVMLAG